MQCEEIRPLLEADALGALEPDERAAVEQHLAGCAECRQRAQAYAQAAHALPDALATRSPLAVPPDLKGRVLQALTAPLAQPQPDKTRLASADGRQPHQPGGRRSLWRWPRALVTFASVLVAVLALVWNAHLNVALAQERALRAEYASLVDQQELVLEVIDSRETVKAFLRPLDGESPSYGKLYTRPGLSHVVVMAARLPFPAAGEAYHVWVTQQGETRLAGVLNVNVQGFGLLLFEAEQPSPVYEAAQLTLQRLDTQHPAGQPILSWPATP
jgi:anti-sigma-K factor RskA